MTLDDALEPWGCGSKQTELIERVCEAVAGLDLGAVLTLGPAVDRGNAGSASKRLAPGLRLGWLLSPASLLQDLTLEKAFDDAGSDVVGQLALADFVKRGDLDRHLRRMRPQYRARRDTLLDALARWLPDARVEAIAAGPYALALLPAGVDESALLASAAERDVGMEGLSWHRSDSGRGPPGLLLGYANLPRAAIDTGIQRIAGPSPPSNSDSRMCGRAAVHAGPADGRRGLRMLVAVFGDSHAHAEALAAVICEADGCGAEELWSLGDMIGGGPDPEWVVRHTRERCRVALMGNHDYGVTGSVDLLRLGEPGSAGVRSIELARERLPAAELEWLRSRKPAARREGVQCWHGSPRNPVWEYVGSSNAAACLAVQRAELGLVGHTHVPAAWQQTPRGANRVEIRPGEPLDIAAGKWLLNPGAAGAPVPSRLAWWDALEAQAAEGACWLLLDLDERTATWRRARYDPIPARTRARALALDDCRDPHPI